MRGGLVPVGDDAGNFRFKPGNPFIQVGLRIGRKILSREARGRVSCGPWQIRFFHYNPTSPAKRLAVNPRDGYSPQVVG